LGRLDDSLKTKLIKFGEF